MCVVKGNEGWPVSENPKGPEICQGTSKGFYHGSISLIVVDRFEGVLRSRR